MSSLHVGKMPSLICLVLIKNAMKNSLGSSLTQNELCRPTGQYRAMSFPMNSLPQRADFCAPHGASLHPHFTAHFRLTGPASPGIPKYQNPTNSTHPAEITDDPHATCVQILSNRVNMLKLMDITENSAPPWSQERKSRQEGGLRINRVRQRCQQARPAEHRKRG